MYDRMTINGNFIIILYIVCIYIIYIYVLFYGIFNKLKYFVPKKHKLTIQNAYVFSKICYGIEIDGSLSETVNNRLHSVSNKLLKILYKLSPFIAQTSYTKN